jgi:hypothetical protein
VPATGEVPVTIVVVKGVGTDGIVPVGLGWVTKFSVAGDVLVHPAISPAARIRMQPITVMTYAVFMVITFL